MSNLSLEKVLKDSDKAIVIGIGGGGDIVGTIPTAGLLNLFDIEYVLAGIPWERSVFDPVPGPRKFDEIVNASKLNDTVWYCNKDTKTSTGVRFAEAGVSEVLGCETLLVDINYGPRATAEGIVDAAEKIGADLIIGVDVGGDAIATGKEKGIISPLADSTMIAALYNVNKEINTMAGVFGLGSDGELTISELESSLKLIAMNKGILGSWGITQETLNLMERVVEVVPTEASRSPVIYAKGEFNGATIRSGMRFVNLNFSSTATVYIDTVVLFEKISRLARSIAGCASIEEANETLHGLGIKSELDLERERVI